MKKKNKIYSFIAILAICFLCFYNLIFATQNDLYNKVNSRHKEYLKAHCDLIQKVLNNKVIGDAIGSKEVADGSLTLYGWVVSQIKNGKGFSNELLGLAQNAIGGEYLDVDETYILDMVVRIQNELEDGQIIAFCRGIGAIDVISDINNGKRDKALSKWFMSEITNGSNYVSYFDALVGYCNSAYKISDPNLKEDLKPENVSSKLNKRYKYTSVYIEGNFGNSKDMDTYYMGLRDLLNTINLELSRVEDTSYDSSLIDNSAAANTRIKNVVVSISKTIITIIQIASVGGIIFVGVKYMLSSADAKADIKKGMISLVTGMVIVFGASSIINIVIEVTEQIL